MFADNAKVSVGVMMAEVTDYAQPLRAIGQALEVLDVKGFELETAGDKFFIRGSLARAKDQRANKIRAAWDALQAGDRSGSDGPSSIELHYTLSDVERLEAEGRSRRGNSAAMADASRLSQSLRSIGGYLSKKSASLVKLTREMEFVTLEYETSSGNRIKDTFSVKDLYDLWVGMYLQRAERTAH